MIQLENSQSGAAACGVPFKTLYNGDKIPAIGLGTFGSDRFSPAQIAGAVEGALAAGYRHIDCAAVYGNEPQIGAVLEKAIESGIERTELWITSKVWNDMHGKGDVLLACAKSLRDLRLDYLDLYLVHWPFPNYHAPHCDITSRNPDSKPYIHDNFMKTWRQMERLVKMGLVRNIGTSNMTIPKLRLLLKDAAIKPACNEMELHPHFQQPQLFNYCLSEGILPIAYCPIGSPARPQRDRTPCDTVDTQDPVIVRIAAKMNITPAALCIKWAVQRGQVPIPFSLNHYRQNLEAILKNPVSEADMKEIEAIDKNCRLIKGHVFLWKDNQDWQDLWDIDGTIPS